jgi:alpha-N-acetylglucosaminidase
LAVTGQEAIWQAVYRRLGLSDQQIGHFLVGLAYLPFGWMGCIDGWGGPLPSSWIAKHAELQRKILALERDLGMTPVLQGFTGHVPKDLAAVLPDVKLQKLPSWCQFPSTYFVDPQNPLFIRVGKMFVEEQTRQFGSDHLYASDTFIEMPPPSSDPGFLASMGRNIYESMRAADPQAVWILQGWIFFNAPDFWKPPQSRALLTSVPDNHLMVLDLYCDNTPVWPRTEAFYGKPWIWSVLHNFGGLAGLYGDLPKMSLELTKARTSPDRGKLEGMGLPFEGMDHNPIVQDFLLELAWRQDVPRLEEWVPQFAAQRYGRSFPETDQAWEILRKTVYTQGKPAGSILIDRPGLKSLPPAGDAPFMKELRQALSLLIMRADELGELETFQFDLVNLTRELLVGQSTSLVTDIFHAYQQADIQRFDASARQFKRLFQDVDELLATNPHFLLGAWLESAKRWATNSQENRLYEWNARNLITLWGPADSILHEYAARQWSGLFSGFYQKRWELFLFRLREAMQSKQPLNSEKFELEVRAWEEQWTHQREVYPAAPRGNPIVQVRRMIKSWVPDSMVP